MTRLIHTALTRVNVLQVRDYAGLLHLSSGYRVVELHVQTTG